MNKILSPIGGTSGAAGLSPQLQVDILESQLMDALHKQDYVTFLSNLCAFEALGHADILAPPQRIELLYHRAVGLRATGKPLAALMALNEYLNTAGNSGEEYQQAIMMLRPLQEEARK
ncbi:MAG: hypothetical protein NVV60_10075 [Luteimonas sp.]|nr:hypothetical protein [Luteimonas sp.]